MKERKNIRRIAGKKEAVQGFEDHLDLSSIVDFQMGKHSFGAFQNHKKKSGDQAFQLVFAFRVDGIHSYSTPEALAELQAGLEKGLQSAPQSESLTLRLVSKSDCAHRLAQLQKIEEKAPTEAIRYLIAKEAELVEQLSASGVRRPKTLTAYCTYTPNQASTNDDWYSSVVKFMVPLWDKFSDQSAVKGMQRLESFYSEGYERGFLSWNNFLTENLSLNVTPMSADEMWFDLWERFNHGDAPPIPQVIHVTRSGITEEINSRFHSTGHLCDGELPFFDQRFVYLAHKRKFVGSLVFQDKPSGWSTAQDQMHYLWRAIARNDMPNIEVITEIRRAPSESVLQSALDLAKEQEGKDNYAAEKKKRDFHAEHKSEESAGAASALVAGAVPFYVSTVVLMERDTPQDLELDKSILESRFQYPARVIPEQQLAWRIWLDTLPIVWRKMLCKVPTDRRSIYLSGEVTGLMPLLRTRTPADYGLELISNCGTPVWVDLFKNHVHLGIFATQRAGKSVLVSSILTMALAHDIPIVALDYPKGDGSSTFDDYTAFQEENGAYFDIAEQSNNIFELPDVTGLSESEQKSRFKDFKNFLAGALMLLIDSKGSDKALTSNLKSILGSALTAFFDDPLIQIRYEKAITAGYGKESGQGKEEWENTPTLRDFTTFCNKGRLPLDKVKGEDIDRALDLIHLRLNYWLDSPVGKAISQPTSFPSDAKLLVFALRNLNDGEDAEVLALSAYSAALRRALANPKSIFFIDEAPILFQFPAIAELVGRLTANGGKSGIRVIIAAQDPDSIGLSKTGAMVLQNLTTRLIGKIQAAALKSFGEYLGYDIEILRGNIEFERKEGEMFSRWFLDAKGTKTHVKFYPPHAQLAIVANNPDEQQKRDEIMALPQFNGDKYAALDEFAEQLIAQKGRKFYEDETEEEPEEKVTSDTGDRTLVGSGYSAGI